ncbi:MAG: hypothetical protein H0T57_07340 [Rubrobacter sp.]|nr:hypothetical protein [Rubrobacter sp.]
MSLVYDELYAEYGREPTEEEVVCTLSWRVQQARTAAGTTHHAASLPRPVLAEPGTPPAGSSIEKARTREHENSPSRYEDS